jgi:hypothetical protein
MIKRNIASWMPDGENKPWVLINKVYDLSPRVEIIVRAEDRKSKPGITNSVNMSEQEFNHLVAEINKNKGC